MFRQTDKPRWTTHEHQTLTAHKYTAIHKTLQMIYAVLLH